MGLFGASIQMLKPLTTAMALFALAAVASADTASIIPVNAGATPAGRAAIANRRAIFVLIGNSFRPVAEVLRGPVPAQANLAKYANRVAQLADYLPEAFPDISNGGDTRAKADIWSNRPDFERLLQQFRDHAGQLDQAAASHDESALKAAATTVAQDCKGCHEHYRSE